MLFFRFKGGDINCFSLSRLWGKCGTSFDFANISLFSLFVNFLLNFLISLFFLIFLITYQSQLERPLSFWVRECKSLSSLLKLKNVCNLWEREREESVLDSWFLTQEISELFCHSFQLFFFLSGSRLCCGESRLFATDFVNTEKHHTNTLSHWYVLSVIFILDRHTEDSLSFLATCTVASVHDWIGSHASVLKWVKEWHRHCRLSDDFLLPETPPYSCLSQQIAHNTLKWWCCSVRFCFWLLRYFCLLKSFKDFLASAIIFHQIDDDSPMVVPEVLKWYLRFLNLNLWIFISDITNGNSQNYHWDCCDFQSTSRGNSVWERERDEREIWRMTLDGRSWFLDDATYDVVIKSQMEKRPHPPMPKGGWFFCFCFWDFSEILFRMDNEHSPILGRENKR